jgi:hypothetical protein
LNSNYWIGFIILLNIITFLWISEVWIWNEINRIEIKKVNCSCGLPLQKPGPAGFGMGPTHIGILAHETKIGDLPPPFTAGTLSAKSGLPMLARGARRCQGGSLVHGEPMGGGWAQGGSSRRAVDGGAGQAVAAVWTALTSGPRLVWELFNYSKNRSSL